MDIETRFKRALDWLLSARGRIISLSGDKGVRKLGIILPVPGFPPGAPQT